MSLVFSCDSCARSFDKEYKLCAHKEGRHGERSGTISCTAGGACNRIFSTKSGMLQHIEMNRKHQPGYVPMPRKRSRRRGRRGPLAKTVSDTADACYRIVSTQMAMLQHRPIIMGRTYKGSDALPMDSFLLTKDIAQLSRFISDELAPTEEYNKILGQALDELASYLKERVPTLCVKEVFKGGSAGKGTTVRNKSDLDIVIFLNDFSGNPEDYQKELKHLLPQLQKVLETYNKQQPQQTSRVEVTGSTGFAVKITLTVDRSTNEEVDIDILPAFDNIQQHGLQEVYKLMQRCNNFCRRSYSSSLTSLQVQFIKKRPAAVKNLIRLVKYWRKTHFKERSQPRLPSSYQLELFTIHCWQDAGEPEKFDIAQGFKVVMQHLKNPSDIRCQWEDNYVIARFEPTVSDLQEKARKEGKPFILDPANPFNDTAADVDAWDEVADMARLSVNKMDDVTLRPRWSSSA